MKLVERLARRLALVGEQNGALPWEALDEKHGKEWLRDCARAILSELEAAGMCVVKKQSMEDHFAEIESCITSVQGALRHYQQPQDVHFHRALKACREGIAMLTKKVADGTD